ncbi:hypothetical protein IWQ60_008783 [Tieghemiomyces parasiticus]|uniref:RING-type domain-containing protein n=1 Tax=Tieghemiomyces parasiticus TaxID=78921 RepID=A0A9W8DL11_9FUNG|nr:hypothetical protein IWQ60_008783 [Tieghemiomyces parasiticus]
MADPNPCRDVLESHPTSSPGPKDRSIIVALPYHSLAAEPAIDRLPSPHVGVADLPSTGDTGRPSPKLTAVAVVTETASPAAAATMTDSQPSTPTTLPSRPPRRATKRVSEGSEPERRKSLRQRPSPRPTVPSPSAPAPRVSRPRDRSRGSSARTSTASTPSTTTPQTGATAQTCFICGKDLGTDLADVNAHIDSCLQGSAAVTPTPSVSTAPFVEYTWAGETRVRASALVEGGAGAMAAGPVVTMRKQQDQDGDLDIDAEDVPSYGDAQYTDRDVQRAVRERSRARPVSSPATPAGPQFEFYPQPPTLETRPAEADVAPSAPAASATALPADVQLLIDSLKAQVREQRSLAQSTPTCLICMDPYTDPLTSTACWHVHCEQCWLHTLATKKLCPQCQVITQPADLRRIYL